MQTEIRRKTVTYGVTAVLLAVLLAGMCYNFGIQPITQSFPLGLNTFSSYEELKNFLKTNMELAKSLPGRLIFFRGGLEETWDLSAKAAPAHSTTNIQVEGVDEADIVKTDGNFLYVVSGQEVYIIEAYPPEKAKVLSKIILNETYVYGVELYLNGDKLAILGNSVQYVFKYTPYWHSGKMFINVYDISDRSKPTPTRAVSLNGTLSGSRMIGNFVYAVVTQPAIRPSETNETDFEVNLPKIVVNESVKEIQPTEIRYVNVSDVSYSFTTVIAVNIMDYAQEPTYESALISAASCMYVSTGNMYLTVPNTNLWILTAETSQPQYETLIHRVKLDKEKIAWEAEGSVPGYVLNQFSMDEYNGFFRIVTTIGWGENAVNNLFILNMSLSIVGNLTNLDPGKQIYAARFMGDKCYLVTFFQKDPFFVIDVSNSFKPKVLGALEIEGFSGYLHLYDEDHVIGIGMEGSNVKLSLYDVTHVSDPKEIDKFIVLGDWSGTTVLADHKAFLFVKEKNLLAIPVSISWAEIRDEKEYYSKGFWQGAFIFSVSLKGFAFKGNITHQDDAAWIEGGFALKRILYIENILYTVSDRKVKLNSLEDLAFIKEIKLS